MDANYQGLVDARRDFFARKGLTPDTHFIASTGIEARSRTLAATVSMDAYAISGVRADQIQFLSAPDHLSPTYIYGVTFERGVSVAYQDRKHVIISGTASIDSEGRIVHPGDVLPPARPHAGQRRSPAARGRRGICKTCVRLSSTCATRAISTLAERVMRERFGETPCQVVIAPVCRPGWLVEIECQAIAPADHPTLPCF